MKNLLIVLTISLALIACEQSENSDSILSLTESEDMEMESTMQSKSLVNADPPMANAATGVEAQEAPQKPVNSKAKIIRTGNIALEVGDYDRGISDVKIKVRQVGGYLGAENEVRKPSRVSNSLTIRVANDKFDELVEMLTTGDGIENIDYKRINSRDVTMEYLDLESRIKSKTAVLERYRALLGQAKEIKEILEVEDKIRVIQEELESVQGRLKYMKDQVSWSTIHMDIYQNLDYTADTGEKTGFWARLGQAFMKGWNVLLEFFVGLAVMWPFLLLAAGILIGFFRRRRAKKAKE